MSENMKINRINKNSY